jgi:tRNA pseudouridine38-40 synthase
VPTYSLTLEYDGTDFAGWQIQPTVRTAMGTLHDALLAVTGESPALTAAGRTDAGAHAHGQVAGCTLVREWAPDSLRHALNASLPQDLAVRDVAVQPETFNARRDAVERTYRYLIVCRDGHAPVTRRNAWTVRGPLDVDAMRAAASHLVGRHDFAAFGSSPRDGGSTVRNVTGVSVDHVTAGTNDVTGVSVEHVTAGSNHATEPILDMVIITVHADAFLRGMMRSFTGALVKVGRGRATQQWLASLLDGATQRDPRLTIAPARGLHQWAVRYHQMDSTHQELAA